MSQANNMYSRISTNNEIGREQIFTNNTIEWVSVYFKEAYTKNICFYNIPIKWSIEQFLVTVKEWIIQDFDLDRRNYSNYSIDLIEMCQEIPGVNEEEAHRLFPTAIPITFHDKYTINNKWPGFYIKIVLSE
jgi:hypothetical protein